MLFTQKENVRTIGTPGNYNAAVTHIQTNSAVYFLIHRSLILTYVGMNGDKGDEIRKGPIGEDEKILSEGISNGQQDAYDTKWLSYPWVWEGLRVDTGVAADDRVGGVNNCPLSNYRQKFHSET